MRIVRVNNDARVPMLDPVAARILSGAAEVDGCWVWLGVLRHDGYGRVKSNYTTMLAHRASYERFVGPIPEGLVVDHLCRNRACVNPTHLEAVTLAENKRRGDSWAAINARKTHCIYGHEFTEANTYITVEGWRSCRACHRAAQRLRYSLTRVAA